MNATDENFTLIHNNSDLQPITSRVNIRLAQESDLPAMEWEGEFSHFRKMYRNCFDRSRLGITLIWLMELEDAGLIGQCIIQLHSDRSELADGHTRAYLFGFRVRPAYRNLGLGTLMIHTVEDDLTRRGYRSLTLNVAKDNPDAMRLYNRLGFLIVAFEPGIWSYQDQFEQWHTVQEPAWRMEKYLPASRLPAQRSEKPK